MSLDRKIAHIDLTSGRITIDEVPLNWRKGYLGGRGINAYLLLKEIEPGIDPLGPNNRLIFGAGMLTGYPGLGTRMNVSCKSPESGYLGDANMGGDFGAEMVFAGFSHLVIEGKADHPVYLYIHNGDIEIRDARHLWGKDALETQRAIVEELGDPKVKIACIGPAGENLVRFAAIMHGHKAAAARTGVGACMGSKNLKAVAVRGTMEVKAYLPSEFMKYYLEVMNALMERKWVKALGRWGTPLLLQYANHMGFLSVKNHQCTTLGEEGAKIDAEALDKYTTGTVACFSCPVHCRPRHDIKAGKYAGQYGEGPEYATIGSLGNQLGNTDIEHIIYAGNLCNRLGLDTISTGSYIGWVMECYQRGILTQEVTGIPLEWGNTDAITQIIEMIAYRNGFGDILAEGSRARELLPPEAANYLFETKNMPWEMTDERLTKSFGFGLAVASRGADHMRSRPSLDVLLLPSEVLEKIYGKPIDPDFTQYEGRALMVWWHELLFAVTDALGMCRFLTVFSSPQAPQYPEYSRFIELATGLKLTEEELKRAGERIYTAERLFITREGIRRQDDKLPSRYYEPVPDGPSKGACWDPVKFQEMLDEYYQLHGWDQEGVPRPETVKQLEIDL